MKFHPQALVSPNAQNHCVVSSTMLQKQSQHSKETTSKTTRARSQSPSQNNNTTPSTSQRTSQRPMWEVNQTNIDLRIENDEEGHLLCKTRDIMHNGRCTNFFTSKLLISIILHSILDLIN